jgi:hypothetical protein
LKLSHIHTPDREHVAPPPYIRKMSFLKIKIITSFEFFCPPYPLPHFHSLKTKEKGDAELAMRSAGNSNATLPRKARPPPPSSKPPPPPAPPSLVSSSKRKPAETTSSSSSVCDQGPPKKQSRESLLHRPPSLRDVTVYRKQHQVGQGTYGYVILLMNLYGSHIHSTISLLDLFHSLIT